MEVANIIYLLQDLFSSSNAYRFNSCSENEEASFDSDSQQYDMDIWGLSVGKSVHSILNILSHCLVRNRRYKSGERVGERDRQTKIGEDRGERERDR